MAEPLIWEAHIRHSPEWDARRMGISCVGLHFYRKCRIRGCRKNERDGIKSPNKTKALKIIQVYSAITKYLYLCQ